VCRGDELGIVAPMKLRVAAALFAALVWSGCSKETHPLAGGWHEHVAGGGEGLELEFDPASNRLEVHGRPRPDKTHDHWHGTYVLDGQRLKVEWTETGQKVVLQGTLTGDTLSLTGPDNQKLELHRGAAGEHDDH